MNKQAKLGVWTPWAKVLCFHCHGPEFPEGMMSEEKMERMNEPTPIREGYDVTFCDHCYVDVQLDEVVANEHELMRYVIETLNVEANMEQTGGMNSACAVYTKDDGCFYITYSAPEDRKREDQVYWVTRFDRDRDPIGEESQSFRIIADVLGYLNSYREDELRIL